MATGTVNQRLHRIGPFQYARFKPSAPGAPTGAVQHVPVAIAGGGPVGLAVALGLANQGIQSIIVEADDSVCEGSRAICMSRRSLEILERLRVARRLARKGLAWTTGRSFYGNQEILVFHMPSHPGDKFPPMINIQQYYIEQYLLDEVLARNAKEPGTIDIRWASRVTRIAAHGDSVFANVNNGSCEYGIRADWLIACDGGHSTVRSELHLELEGTAYRGRYVIVDIEMRSPDPTERRAWFDPPWARGTTILMHKQPDDIWRLDWQPPVGDSLERQLEPDFMIPFIQRHLDAIGKSSVAWKPVWSSLYRAGAMSLQSYRHGRVLFAGNAAHAMPIFGVRGLNSGLDDADNLAWKLGAVIHGLADDRLLDTYSSERLEAYHVNARNAMRSTEFMSPPNRGFALMREAALSLAGKHKGFARLVDPRQTSAITYHNSPLATPPMEHRGSPAFLGAPLTDVAIEHGRFLTDSLSSNGFTLFWFGTCPIRAELTRETTDARWQCLPCAIREIVPAVGSVTEGVPPDRYAAIRAAYTGNIACLVRPDGHICACWKAIPGVSEVLGAVRRACGRQCDVRG